MILDRAFMRSRVARRIVVLFVACTLVPIAATAVLSYGHVRKLLLDQSYQHLAQLGEAYAGMLYDRLWGVSLLLRQVASDVERGVTPVPLRSREALSAQLDALVVERPEGSSAQLGKLTRPFAAPSAPERKTLAKGESVMRTYASAGAPTIVVMAHAINPADLREGLVIAEIHGAYLWGEADAFPAVTHFVVADAGGTLLFSSEGQAQALLDALAGLQPHTPNGRLTYASAEGPQLASYRELFLESHFFVRGWTVAATRPEADVLAPIAAFQQSFLLATALALLCIALMSIVQIRRTLVPLERLIDGTRRAADKDFAVQVPVGRNDEFGELARSFNTMTVRLGRQFTALSTLAEIDRAILTRPDVEQVIDAVLRCIRLIVPAERASVVLVDRHAAASARVFTRGPVDGAATELVRVRTVAVGAKQLALQPEGEWLDPADVPPYALPLADPGAMLFAVPISWQGETIGAFVVGVRQGLLSADEESRVRALADRVGVAFAAATKDEQLYYQAHYDPLTRLPNRLYFRDQLERAIERAARVNSELAVLLVDLDYFKHVNDSVGHAAGDRVLDDAAERMRHCVRASDVVGRLGGDEFTILTADLSNAQNAAKVAHNVIAAMSRPFVTGGQEHFLSASVGIAVYPADGTTAEELLRNADTAMYRAKDGGRGRSVFFEERMNVAAMARVRSERELRHAFDSGEFFLAYQPITSLQTGRLSGAEALLRWDHPSRGVLTPEHFVQLAEETGLIDTLGEWVLRTACAELSSMRIHDAPLSRISVNVSARQFRQPDFATTVRRIVEGAGLGMSSIEIEITESLLLDATPAVEAMLRALSAMGVRIALDDFGTGYSSLAYLKRFPVDAVKIDRTFVKDLPFDRSSAAITGAIISMAHALEKRVVAEGVETAEQAAFLRELGCDELQGYHLAKPLRAKELAAFLARRSETGTTPRSQAAAAE